MKEVKFHTSKERTYYINEQGRCYSVSKKTGNVRILSYHINTTNNYPMVSVTGKHYYLHRLMAESFIPNPDNLPVINHLNGDKQDYSIPNLVWTTQQDNAQH